MDWVLLYTILERLTVPQKNKQFVQIRIDIFASIYRSKFTGKHFDETFLGLQDKYSDSCCHTCFYVTFKIQNINFTALKYYKHSVYKVLHKNIVIDYALFFIIR